MIGGVGSTGSLGMGVAFTLKDRFSRTADKIMTKYGQLETTTEAITQNINRGFRQLKIGAAQMAFGAVMLAPMLLGVKYSMAFNAAMSDVQAKTHAASNEMALMRQQALDLGEATIFTATQAAEGQAFLGMAGWNTQQILKGMPAMLDLAAAGELSLARAADIASNVLGQFGLDASYAGRMSDVLAYTATSANTNIEQLADALKYMGPTAQMLGMSLEETNAMIGLLGNNGLQGSLATRALSTAMARLAKPTKEMLQVMDKYNIRAFDKNGEFVGMGNFMGELEKKSKKLTQQQKLALAATIFNAEGIQEAGVLLNSVYRTVENGEEVVYSGAEAIREYTKAIEKSNGAAKEMAETKLDNLKGDIIKLRSAWETMWIRIGNSQENGLRPLIQNLTKLIKLGSEFVTSPFGRYVLKVTTYLGTMALLVGLNNVRIGAMRMLTGQAAMMIARFGSTTLAANIAQKGFIVGLLTTNLNLKSLRFRTLRMAVANRALAASFWSVKGGMSSLRSVNIVKWLGGMTAGFSGLAGAVWAAVAPLLPIIAAVAAVAAIIAAGYKSWKLYQDVLSGTAKETTSLQSYMVRFGAFIQGFIDGATTVFNEMRVALQPVFDVIRETLNDLGFSFEKATSPIEYWRQIGEGAAKFLMSTLVPSVKFLAGVIKWTTAWTRLIIKAVRFAISAFRDWGGAIDYLKSIISVFASNVIPWVVSGFKSVGGAIVDSIKNGLIAKWDGLKRWFKENYLSLISPATMLIGAGKAIFSGSHEQNDVGTYTPSFQKSNVQQTVERVVNGKQNVQPKQEPQTQESVNRTIVNNIVVEMDGHEVARKVVEHNDKNDSRR